jgi:hypothetical protein
MPRASRSSKFTLATDMDEHFPRRTVEEIVEQVVAECYGELPWDWGGLWQIAASIQIDHQDANWEEVRTIGLGVVERLLADPHVHAGQFTGTGFDVWPLTPQESMDRIAQEWSLLQRSPTINEIC